MKLHLGDAVLVITGKDKGKSGTVMRVLPLEQRVVISGINMRTRHVKKTAQQAGQIVKFEASIHASNVMLLDPKTKKPSRIAYKIDDKGKKLRISVLSGEEVKKVKPQTKQLRSKTEKPKQEKKAEKESPAEIAKEKKQPFWKRMQFGSAVQADVAEQPRSKQDHTIAEQNIPHKSAGRGS